MKENRKPKVGIIMGDPAGIGPEIAVKVLASSEIREVCQPIVIGDGRVLKEAVKQWHPDLSVHILADVSQSQDSKSVVNILGTMSADPAKVAIGQPSAIGGRAVFDDLNAAVRLAQQGKINGMVLGPHNKYSVNLAGVSFAGYPPLLAKLTSSRYAFNMLVAGPIRIVGATLHLPLKEVSQVLTQDLVLATIEAANGAVKRLGIKEPKIAVAGLNPHCGEEGLFGSEEETIIRPAIAVAKANGIRVSGPWPADSLFVGLKEKQDYDAYVAMFHDQSHIPIKTVAFERIVGLIIGTPLIAATVGHGSAFDIAGKGIANPTPMMETIKLVARSCRGESG